MAALPIHPTRRSSAVVATALVVVATHSAGGAAQMPTGGVATGGAGAESYAENLVISATLTAA